MWLFPFHDTILKTNLDRFQVSKEIAFNTFLSDAGYKKSDGAQKFYFGTVSEDEFDLESIAGNQKLVNYCSGTIRGVENEIYIFCRFGAFRYRRIYIGMILFLLVAFSKLAFDFVKYGLQGMGQTFSILLFIIFCALLAFMVYSCSQFAKKRQASVDFFRGMTQSDVIQDADVPRIFR
jgi:hypothetical protein